MLTKDIIIIGKISVFIIILMVFMFFYNRYISNKINNLLDKGNYDQVNNFVNRLIREHWKNSIYYEIKLNILFMQGDLLKLNAFIDLIPAKKEKIPNIQFWILSSQTILSYIDKSPLFEQKLKEFRDLKLKLNKRYHNVLEIIQAIQLILNGESHESTQLLIQLKQFSNNDVTKFIASYLLTEIYKTKNKYKEMKEEIKASRSYLVPNHFQQLMSSHEVMK